MVKQKNTRRLGTVLGHLAALALLGVLAWALASGLASASARVTWHPSVVMLFLMLVVVGSAGYAVACGLFAFQNALRLRRHDAAVNALGEKISQLEEAASRDSLTGVYSRFFGLSVLQARMEEARLHSTALSLIFLDIDDFKRINDDYGHSAGDRVLKQIVTQITPRSADDVVCRFGGDEFLIVCAVGTDQAGACTLAERLGAGVASYAFMVQPSTAMRASLTVSCGVTAFAPQSDTQQSLLERVSQALQSAKSMKRQGAVGRKSFVYSLGVT